MNRPLIVLCTGSDCAHRLASTGTDAVDQLRAVTRTTPGGVLITTGCLRRCAGAAVGMVGWQVSSRVEAADRPGLTMSEPLVLAGVHQHSAARALAGWISRHAGTTGRHPLETLPLSLRAHLAS